MARDFDLTETVVREWVKQAERDAGSRQDGGLTSSEREALAQLRRENRRLREDMDIAVSSRSFADGQLPIVPANSSGSGRGRPMSTEPAMFRRAPVPAASR